MVPTAARNYKSYVQAVIEGTRQSMRATRDSLAGHLERMHQDLKETMDAPSTDAMATTDCLWHFFDPRRCNRAKRMEECADYLDELSSKLDLFLLRQAELDMLDV